MRDLIDYPAYIPTGEVSNYERITFTNEYGVLKFFMVVGRSRISEKSLLQHLI